MNKNKSIVIWLLSGCALIFIMVVVGGITRLTDSGLSMVKWNLFMGAIPPLNDVLLRLTKLRCDPNGGVKISLC